MTVVLNSGSNADFSIGLIATSRHQSGSYMPWAQHQPRMDWVVAPQGGPALDYIRNNLGYESTRYSRTYFNALSSEQWTGHTALFVRVQGGADAGAAAATVWRLGLTGGAGLQLKHRSIV